MVVHGMAGPDRIAVDDGREDAFVFALGGFPDLGRDEMLFEPAEHRAGGAEVPDMRDGGGQRGVAAGCRDGAVEGLVVGAGRVAQRHRRVRRRDRGDLRGRGLLGRQRRALGLQQQARVEQVERTDVGVAGLGRRRDAIVAIGEVTWSANNEFLLVAIPLFIMLGEVLLRAGFAERMYAAMSL